MSLLSDLDKTSKEFRGSELMHLLTDEVEVVVGTIGVVVKEDLAEGLCGPPEL